MASMTTTPAASALGCSTSMTFRRPPAASFRSRFSVMAKGSQHPEGGKIIQMDIAGAESSKGGQRRELMFGLAASAIWSAAKLAMALEEPKRGTPEAKKKYAPVCVTMPTARICRK